MSWKFAIKSKAEADLSWFRRNDRKLYGKCLDLIRAVAEDPYTGIGNPERLKYFHENTWSRRLDQMHRMVYIVWANTKEIDLVSFRYHYE